jgi:hypothetical protein
MRWAAEVKQTRQRDAEKRLAASRDLTPIDRDRRIQEITDEDVQLGWLLNKSYAPAGVRKILAVSLKKAGKTDEQSLAIIKRIHFMRQAVVARELLSPPPAPEDKAKPEDKTGSDFTTPETGDSTGPSSGESPDVT